jgi:hypothetical protein
MNFRSNDLSVKWPFSVKAFGQMNFRSNEFSVKRPSAQFFFGQMTFSAEGWFGQMTIFCKKSVIWPFGKMNFRSNGVRLNGDSVKWPFGQMVFGQTVFGQMVFWSNGVRSKKFGKMTSVKWSRTSKAHSKIWKVVEQKLFLISICIFWDYKPKQFLKFLHTKTLQPRKKWLKVVFIDFFPGRISHSYEIKDLKYHKQKKIDWETERLPGVKGKEFGWVSITPARDSHFLSHFFFYITSTTCC